VSGRKLTKKVQAEKAKKDLEFERQSVELAKKRKTGEISDIVWIVQDKKLKADYEEWALRVGVYEKVDEISMLEQETEIMLMNAASLNARRVKAGLDKVSFG